MIDRTYHLLSDLFHRGEKGQNEEELVNFLVYQLYDLYGLKSSAVLFFIESGQFEIFAHRGLSRGFIKQLYSLPEKKIVMEAKEREVYVDSNDPRWNLPDYCFEHRTPFRLAVPLKYCGETVGVLFMDWEEGHVYSEQMREDVRLVAGVVAAYLKVKSLKSRISMVPDIDPLTGLYSFKYFHEALFREITRAEELGRKMSLFFAEIRNIRDMNRVYGHVAGDKNIVLLGERVKKHFRRVDVVSRTGDNFYVVIPELGHEGAREVVESLLRDLDESPIGEGEIHLNLASGLVTYPDHGTNERDLITLVESLVHESRRKGGNALSTP